MAVTCCERDQQLTVCDWHLPAGGGGRGGVASAGDAAATKDAVEAAARADLEAMVLRIERHFKADTQRPLTSLS